MEKRTEIEIQKEVRWLCAEQRYICNGEFTKSNYKVRDNCHRTRSIEERHTRCKINYYTNKYIPVVFHNLRGYDSHILLN